MADKIKLPPLPQPDGYCAITKAGSVVVPPSQYAQHNAYAIFTAEQLRARDLEVARVVIEAAAKVCDLWATRDHMYVNGALRCGEDIRALKVSHD